MWLVLGGGLQSVWDLYGLTFTCVGQQVDVNHRHTNTNCTTHNPPLQVSRLQRQSNSLVGHAACLSEDLSDRTALADALQRERSRLEQELGQANGETQATEFSTPNEDGLTGADGRSAPSVPLPGANTVDAVNGEKVAAGAPDSAETVAISTAAAIEAVETKASGAVAAAEARSLALEEMVDSLLSEKVEWEEEREARATEAMRLRARARGLEDTIVCRGMREGGGGRTTGPAHETIVQGLRKLLLERTRDVEEMHVSTERLGEVSGVSVVAGVWFCCVNGGLRASNSGCVRCACCRHCFTGSVVSSVDV